MPADVLCGLLGYHQRQAQLLVMVQVVLQLKQVRRARLVVHLQCWQFGFKLRVFLSSYAVLLQNSCLRKDPQPSGN